MTKMEISRRRFVTTAVLAGGGMILGFQLPGVSRAMAAAALPEGWVPPTDGIEFNAWLTIDTDGIVTVRCPYTEMGQGGMTSVAQMVAEELNVPWANVRGVLADARRNNLEGEPYGTMATGGSNLVRNRHPMIFGAAASARERLKEAAAQEWGVNRADVVADQGMLTAGDKSAGYGEFATAAAAVSLEEEPAMKSPADWWLAGTSVPRMDIDLKVDGRAVYPVDVKIDGMVYAAVRACPVPGGRLVSFDASAVMNRPGVIDVVELEQVQEEPGGSDMLSAVAVVADSWYRAQTALDLLPVEWDFGSFADNSDAAMEEIAKQMMDEEAPHVEEVRGDPRQLLADAHEVITFDFHRPYEAHATMCPPSAVANVTDARVDVWSYSQNAGSSHLQAADQSGRDPADVYYHQTYQGGGFGGGFTTDVTRQAVEISKQVGRPVKLLWSREEDIRQNRSRPPVWGRFSATLGDDGLPTAMLARMVGESQQPAYADRGIVNMPYQVPNFRHERNFVPANQQRGPHRAPGNNANAFGLEQFVDMMAMAGDWDPLEWRLKMTEGNERWQRVLNAIKEESGFTTDLPAGMGMGIGVVDSHGSVVGAVATVEVTRRGALFIDNILIVVNCGYTLNPRAAGEQIEGSVAWELSHVMNGGIRMSNGRFQNTNFDSYKMLRIQDMPNVKYIYANSESDWWGGIGEPIVPPLPPAIVNAIYFATGRRVGSTPLLQHDLSPV